MNEQTDLNRYFVIRDLAVVEALANSLTQQLCPPQAGQVISELKNTHKVITTISDLLDEINTIKRELRLGLLR